MCVKVLSSRQVISTCQMNLQEQGSWRIIDVSGHVSRIQGIGADTKKLGRRDTKM